MNVLRVIYVWQPPSLFNLWFSGSVSWPHRSGTALPLANPVAFPGLRVFTAFAPRTTVHWTSFPLSRHPASSSPLAPLCPGTSHLLPEPHRVCISDSGVTCPLLLPLAASHKPSVSSCHPNCAQPLVPVLPFTIFFTPTLRLAPQLPRAVSVLEAGTPGPYWPSPAAQPSSPFPRFLRLQMRLMLF